MFDQTTVAGTRNTIGDWVLRGAVAVVFVIFGAEKFPSGPDSSWVGLFNQIGFGQWFRYFTGAIEILGGLLVLIPATVTLGLALLGCTMLSAALILIFVVGRPGDSIFSVLFFIGLTVLWRTRAGEAGPSSGASHTRNH